MTDFHTPIDWDALESDSADPPEVQQAFDYFVNQVGGPQIASQWDAKQGYTRLQARLRLQHAAFGPALPATGQTKNQTTGHSRGKLDVFRYAAASLVLAMVVFVATWQGTHTAVPSHHAETSAYTTGKAQRATITLSDGSVVTLSVASRLDVPIDYAAGNRTLRLTGEAMFSVSHHTNTPFTVVAGPSVTRVLGTQFAVRHYPTDTAAIIAVKDGKVGVQSFVLSANQQVMVTRSGVHPTQPVTRGRFGFASGILTIDGMSLRDAVTELNRWYSAEIQFADPSLASRRITGEFAAGSVADLAAILAVTFDDLGVIRDGQMLTLYRR